MSKPIDQEREAFARAIWNIRREDEDRCDMELEDIPRTHSVWRESDAVLAIPAAVQPAGVVVPDGYVLVPSVADLPMKNAGWQEADRQGVDPESIEMQPIWHAMLAAAPHPVSGEQKAADVAGLVEAIQLHLSTISDRLADNEAVCASRRSMTKALDRFLKAQQGDRDDT